MPRYTVEFSYDVPHYVHEEIEAADEAAAIAEAKRKHAEDDINWERQKANWDGSSDIEITGLWRGEAYRGPNIKVK